MSNRVGPLILSHPVAQEQFISTREVVTARAADSEGNPRTTGDTHARWKRNGRGMADCHVTLIGPMNADPDRAESVRDTLREHLEPSGFRSVDGWLDAIEDLNGALPERGHLYRVEFQRAREPLKEWLHDEYGPTACDGCDERVAPWVSAGGGSASGRGPRGRPQSASWCAWDTTGIPPEDRPDGWRVTLPENAPDVAADGEAMTDGGKDTRLPKTLTGHASVDGVEVCDGADGHDCTREDPILTRGEDEIHVTKYGPGSDRHGRHVLCGACKDRQTALNIADDPALAGLFRDELPDLRERFPDILGDLETGVESGE